MQQALPILKLKPVVRFCEFPFGMASDPSMREFMVDQPWESQREAVAYLCSGHILGYLMGSRLRDHFDRTSYADVIVNGGREGGLTPLTDGTYFWPAGLAYFVERYNVRLPQEFLDHAASNGWKVDEARASRGYFDYDY
jgi:hypothetical protein